MEHSSLNLAQAHLTLALAASSTSLNPKSQIIEFGCIFHLYIRFNFNQIFKKYISKPLPTTEFDRNYITCQIIHVQLVNIYKVHTYACNIVILNFSIVIILSNLFVIFRETDMNSTNIISMNGNTTQLTNIKVGTFTLHWRIWEVYSIMVSSLAIKNQPLAWKK